MARRLRYQVAVSQDGFIAGLPPGGTTTLKLVDHKILPKSGIAILAYTVPGGAAAPPIGFIKRPKAKTRAAGTTVKQKPVKKKPVEKKPLAKKRTRR